MKTNDRVMSRTGMTGTVLKVEHDRLRNEGNAMAKVQWDNIWKSVGWIGQAHLWVIREAKA